MVQVTSTFDGCFVIVDGVVRGRFSDLLSAVVSARNWGF
jgi:hypothetical protein